MSIVYAEITLRNAIDVSMARKGNLKEDEIRGITVQAMVDTGAWALVINEKTCKELGLYVQENVPSSLADGTEGHYDMAGPVEIIWKDRHAFSSALVLPNAGDVLLGAIPLEMLDLTVNPLRELVGIHGDIVKYRI